MDHGADTIGEALLRLLVAPGLGPATRRRLLAHFGSAERAVGATAAQIAAIRGVGLESARSIRRALDRADPAAEREALRGAGARIILHGDRGFPTLLGLLPDPPDALWARGAMDEDDRLAVALVGSRRCSTYGREQADRFAAALVEAGLTIVSGGARGVDAAARRGALRSGGRTIAVLGCGLGRCYPPEHAALFSSIVESGGALLSEHRMSAPPRARHFPRRNRIISGLALGVVVIEAGLRSGALITARLAAETHGREVMAVPGRIDTPSGAGSLRLLRDGAALVTGPQDVLRQLDCAGHLLRAAAEHAGPVASAEAPAPVGPPLSDAGRAILEALDDGTAPMPIEVLAMRIGQPIDALLVELTALEMTGRIRRDHRGLRRG